MSQVWDGKEERRNFDRRKCEEHSGCMARMDNVAERIKAIEDKDPVPFNRYKWGLGLIVTSTITLFTVVLYLIFGTTETYKDIQSDLGTIKTEIVILGSNSNTQLSVLNKEIEELKRRLYHDQHFPTQAR